MESFPEARFFRNGDARELWQRYCGFLDLSVEKFMDIQGYLLLEQLKLVRGAPLGRKLLLGREPASVEEFRRTIPITSYDHYIPSIGQRQEDALSEKPYFWCHSSGRKGNFKWIPYTRAAFDRIARYVVAVGILAAADQREQIRLSPRDRVLVNLTPRPYGSGSLIHHFAEYFPLRCIPPLEVAEEADFRKRTETAFKLALDEGVDYIFSSSTVLVKIAEIFANQESKLKFSSSVAHPRAFRRLAQAWLKSKLARRPMMPRDLWSAKGLITFGVDTPLYEREIARLWGRVPYQVYGTTEMLISAVQGWNRRALTFLPDVAFWEFIPQTEWQKSREDPAYQPRTVLANELEAGKQYELVYTHFYGMPLMRYRIGDVFKVVALEDAETGVRLPQVVFQARASEIIDMAGLTQIDKKTLWQALENAGVQAEGWCARKEYHQNAGYLRLYIELKDGSSVGVAQNGHRSRELESLLEEQLRAVDVDYRDLDGWLGQKRSVTVTILAPQTFARYFDEQRAGGAPLAKLRPPHINPPEPVVSRLLELSSRNGGP